MTRRERLRRCYSNRELDRPAVYSRGGFRDNDPTYDRLKKYLNQYTELKRGWNRTGLETQYSEESYTEPYDKDFERHVSLLSR